MTQERTNTYAVKDTVVLVTGAGSGMGREIARRFLDNGAVVGLVGRREEPLRETVSGYSPERYDIIPGDISDNGEAQRIIGDFTSRHGRLDTLVNNAGIAGGAAIEDQSEADWHQKFAVNVDGLFFLAQAAMPYLKDSRGSIVAVSSVSGLAGDPGQFAYNASKHAVNGFVRSLALDVGKDGVRVNAVAPAFTLTPMNEGAGRSDEDLAPFVNRVALGRAGEPEDIAPAVLFLASPDAGYITGSVLTVDGGTTASTGQPL